MIPRPILERFLQPAVLLSLAAISPVRAEKSGYCLFHPTPAEEMRELSTDRPDQTESPYTVDAGHFQLEMDFASYTHDHDTANGADTRSRSLSVAPVNLKVGLLNNVDLQLMADPYVRDSVKDRIAGTTVKDSGFGDLTTRLKINLWGNDGGDSALGLMPFIKWPLSASGVRNGDTEGGLIVPYALSLPGGWGMGAMGEVDVVSDGAGGYDREYLASLTFGHDLTESLGAYVEFVAVTGDSPGFEWQGQFDVGFTYALSENAQLDFGCNFGVTSSAPDYNPFIGYTIRY